MVADHLAEVVVLGKGIGESVLARVGGDWVIIDSFMTPDGPAPIAYLRERGVEPLSVRAVVLTHLHADHSAGIDIVVDECRNAVFHMPAAVPGDRWNELLAALDAEPSSLRNKTREISTAFRIASDTRRFHPVGATNILPTAGIDMIAIGPTTRAMNAAHAHLSARDEVAARAVLRENYTSIVIWLQAKSSSALLGADMDAKELLGWPQLLEEHGDRTWLRAAGLVKVAHHGSARAHHSPIYDAWIDSGAVGVIAPNSSSKLPRADMVDELKTHLDTLWLAGPPTKRDLTPDDATSTAVLGVVRVVTDGDGTWTADAMTPAHQL